MLPGRACYLLHPAGATVKPPAQLVPLSDHLNAGVTLVLTMAAHSE